MSDGTLEHFLLDEINALLLMTDFGTQTRMSQRPAPTSTATDSSAGHSTPSTAGCSSSVPSRSLEMANGSSHLGDSTGVGHGDTRSVGINAQLKCSLCGVKESTGRPSVLCFDCSTHFTSHGQTVARNNMCMGLSPDGRHVDDLDDFELLRQCLATTGSPLSADFRQRAYAVVEILEAQKAQNRGQNRGNTEAHNGGSYDMDKAGNLGISRRLESLDAYVQIEAKSRASMSTLYDREFGRVGYDMSVTKTKIDELTAQVEALAAMPTCLEAERDVVVDVKKGELQAMLEAAVEQKSGELRALEDVAVKKQLSDLQAELSEEKSERKKLTELITASDGQTVTPSFRRKFQAIVSAAMDANACDAQRMSSSTVEKRPSVLQAVDEDEEEDKYERLSASLDGNLQGLTDTLSSHDASVRGLHRAHDMKPDRPTSSTPAGDFEAYLGGTETKHVSCTVSPDQLEQLITSLAKVNRDLAGSPQGLASNAQGPPTNTESPVHNIDRTQLEEMIATIANIGLDIDHTSSRVTTLEKAFDDGQNDQRMTDIELQIAKLHEYDAQDMGISHNGVKKPGQYVEMEIYNRYMGRSMGRVVALEKEFKSLVAKLDRRPHYGLDVADRVPQDNRIADLEKKVGDVNERMRKVPDRNVVYAQYKKDAVVIAFLVELEKERFHIEELDKQIQHCQYNGKKVTEEKGYLKTFWSRHANLVANFAEDRETQNNKILELKADIATVSKKVASKLGKAWSARVGVDDDALNDGAVEDNTVGAGEMGNRSRLGSSC